MWDETVSKMLIGTLFVSSVYDMIPLSIIQNRKQNSKEKQTPAIPMLCVSFTRPNSTLTSPSMFCVMTRNFGKARTSEAIASCPALGVLRVKLMGKYLRKNSLYHRRGSRRNTERLPCAAAVTHHTESLPPLNVGIPVQVRVLSIYTISIKIEIVYSQVSAQYTCR